jgi:ankyrin repeat protein
MMTTTDRQLFAASCNGLVEAVDRALSDGASIDHLDENGVTPLMAAVFNDQAAMVQHLLNCGANPNAGLDPPLSLAAAKGLVDIGRLLLRREVTDVNARNHRNFTPLHDAAEQGHVEMVRVLLSHGADVNSMGNGSVTPLHFAAQNGHGVVVALLLQYGVRTDVVATNGETARDSAKRKGHEEIARRLEEEAGHPRSPRSETTRSNGIEPAVVLDVEWDDDCIRHVHRQRCACGRFWTMQHYSRNDGIDVIECVCPECNVRRMFAFRPAKIHSSVNELIRDNQQFVRL